MPIAVKDPHMGLVKGENLKMMHRIGSIVVITAGLIGVAFGFEGSVTSKNPFRVFSDNDNKEGRHSRGKRRSDDDSNRNGNRNTGNNMNGDSSDNDSSRNQNSNRSVNDNSSDRGSSQDNDSNGNSNQNSNNNENSSNNSSSSGITREQARQIALENVPGTVIKDEFKNGKGRSIYEFYIRKSNGGLFEVKIDASNGNVLEIESK